MNYTNTIDFKKVFEKTIQLHSTNHVPTDKDVERLTIKVPYEKAPLYNKADEINLAYHSLLKYFIKNDIEEMKVAGIDITKDFVEKKIIIHLYKIVDKDICFTISGKQLFEAIKK